MSDIINMIVIVQMPSKSYMIIRYMIRARTHHIKDSISQYYFQWNLAFHFCKKQCYRHKDKILYSPSNTAIESLVVSSQGFYRALMADGVHYSYITFWLKLFHFLIRDGMMFTRKEFGASHTIHSCNNNIKFSIRDTDRMRIKVNSA